MKEVEEREHDADMRVRSETSPASPASPAPPADASRCAVCGQPFLLPLPGKTVCEIRDDAHTAARVLVGATR